MRKIEVQQNFIEEWTRYIVPVTINGVTPEQRRQANAERMRKIEEDQYYGYSGYDEYSEEQYV